MPTIKEPRALLAAPPGLRGYGLHLTQGRQPAQGLQLDLPDPLAGESQAAADLLEGLRLRVVEAVAEHEHLPLPLVQRGERLRERLGAQRDLDLFLGQGIVAGDEVAEDRVLLLADRLVERRRRARGPAHLERLLDRQTRLPGDLLERRLAAEPPPERALGTVHLLEPLDDVDRHADRARLVREGAGDRLADPPGRVGRELVAASPVELLDR